jgi:hypothetical protein
MSLTRDDWLNSAVTAVLDAAPENREETIAQAVEAFSGTLKSCFPNLSDDALAKNASTYYDDLLARLAEIQPKEKDSKAAKRQKN